MQNSPKNSQTAMPENNEIVMILLVDLTFWVEFVIAESIEDVGRVNFSTLVGSFGYVLALVEFC